MQSMIVYLIEKTSTYAETEFEATEVKDATLDPVRATYLRDWHEAYAIDALFSDTSEVLGNSVTDALINEWLEFGVLETFTINSKDLV